MAKTLYLMRHGETLFNRRKLLQGTSDSALTEHGIEQALRARVLLDSLVIDHLYCSPLWRAEKTLQVATRNALPYQTHEGLREREFGEFEAAPWAVCPDYPYGDFFVPFGGEGEQEFEDRVRSVTHELMGRRRHKSVLVVTHGDFIDMFARIWAQHGTIPYDATTIGNCGVIEYSYDDEVFSSVAIHNPGCEG